MKLSSFFVMAVSAIVTTLSLLALPRAVHAQSNQGQANGAVFVPDTTAYNAADRGIRAHTNHLLLASPAAGLGPSGGMTPTQIRSFYQMPATGGGGVIAIVDAYDYPTAVNDFNVFSTQFGLPKETGTGSVFQVVYGTSTGKKPKGNPGWAQEAALDIGWAHGMAPNAKIVLVEAASSSFADLFTAVDIASQIAGVKQVSMSWGGNEFSTEASYDTHFPQNKGIVYFASSGDTGALSNIPRALRMSLRLAEQASPRIAAALL